MKLVHAYYYTCIFAMPPGARVRLPIWCYVNFADWLGFVVHVLSWLQIILTGIQILVYVHV